MGNGRGPEQDLSALPDRTCDARLGSDGSVVGYLYVPHNTHLTAEDAVFADDCGACHTALRRHNGIFAYYHVMCNLAQIVDANPVADNG